MTKANRTHHAEDVLARIEREQQLADRPAGPVAEAFRGQGVNMAFLGLAAASYAPDIADAVSEGGEHLLSAVDEVADSGTEVVSDLGLGDFSSYQG